jgi:putative ABC transport system permease protein
VKPLLAAFRVQARYWRGHRVQAGLCFAGIVLGVAVYCAIQLANQGALRAFAEGTAAFAGSATHRVFAPDGGGLPDGLFVRIASAPGVQAATPVLRARMRLLAPQPLVLTVLGVDALSDAAFRTFRFVAQGAAGDGTALLERFLAEPDALLLPTALARRLGVTPGAALLAETPDGPRTFHVLALFDPPAGQAGAFARTAIQDVAAHQETFGTPGRLDAIRLILAPHREAGAEAAVRALLPPGTALEPAGSRAERVERMSRAFRLNVETMGLFALLVALFLIFNAASFSVVQRERTLAMLRCIGATTRTVFLALLGEALLVGAAGGALGVLAGRALGEAMLRNTGATLFEVVLHVEPQPATASLDARTWAIGLGLGVGVSLLGALVPAWGGAHVSPLGAVQAARQPGARRFPLAAWTLAGALGLALAALLLAWPSDSLPAGLAGATALALGMAALCPPAVALASRAGAAPLGRLLGAPGRMAARNLGRSLTRTGVAAASLMVALALALAIEITVRSFKSTLELWLGQVLTADLYLEPLPEGGDPLDADTLARLRALPFVAQLSVLRSRRIVLAGREPLVLALDADAHAARSRLPTLHVSPAEAFARLQAGEIFVSEVLANALGLRERDRLAVPTPQGARDYTIGAIVRNYSESQGVVYFSLQRFETLFGTDSPAHGELWLRTGADPAQALAALERMPALARVQISPNAALRRDALRIFDRTFAITDVMGTLAAFVAFMAVVSALTALLEERMRTLGYLRAIGISRRALGASLAIEAALLAGVAALVSWLTGLLMSGVLVFVINRRAFGWTLQFLPGEGSYGRLLALALAAGLLGSLYPIWRATRASIVATIREE